MSRVLLQLGVVAIAAGFVASTAQGATGHIPGNFRISNAGSALYNIPIAVPPGPHGLQPRLTLNYSSNSGSGPLGVGWNVVGLSAVTRCNHTYVQDAGLPASVTLTVADAFCLDGQRLRITSSGGLPTYGLDGTTYQTELANFANVTAHVSTPANGPSSFTVQGKDGLTYEYGNGGNSLVVAGGTSIATAWLLDKVTDRKNNSMVITYLAPSATLTGTSVPSTISWAPVSAGSGSFSYTLTFNYSTTSEVLNAAYVGGTPIVNQDLLSNITIATTGGTAIRKYAFTYTASSATGRSTLTQIRECADVAESNCLQPTNITYQQGAAGLSTSAIAASSTTALPVTRFDFNADGFDDLLTTNGSTTFISFGSASGYGSPINTGIAGWSTVGDVWGNGRDSILVISGTTLSAYTWDDSSGSFGVATATVTTPPATTKFHLVDVNGDGRLDLVYTTNKTTTSLGETTYSLDTTVFLNASFGSTFSFNPPTINTVHSCFNCAITAFGPTSAGTGRLKAWDFDGDGRGDLLIWVQQIVGSTIHDNLMRLVGSGTNFSAVLQATSTGASPPAFPTVTNWNNDACSDISWINFQISGCGGASAGAILVSGTRVVTMDWNGDGRMDLVVANGSTLGVYLSTGTGLSSLQPTSIPYSSNCIYWAADIDGDGQDDLICWDVTFGGSNLISYYLHNSAGQPPDLLNSITDGYGVNFSPSYVTTARGSYTKGSVPSYPEQAAATPFNVVNQVVSSDGVGSTFTRTMSYSGARANGQGYGFEGFQSMTVHDTRAGSLVASSHFLTAFPYTGRLDYTDLFQNDGTTPVEHVAYTNARRDLSTVAGNQRTFAYPQTITTQRYEVAASGDPANGAPITSTVTTINTMDDYGNARNVTTTVKDIDAASPYVNQQWSTTRDLAISPSDDANWCLNLPTQVVVTNTAPGVATLSQTKSSTPDYALCHQLDQTIASGSAYAVSQSFVYDDFDNVKTVTTTGSGMAARVTSVDWGTGGQFPMSITNALSQTSHFEYDLKLGVRTKATDANGIFTSWHYDAFGRRDTETRPDSTRTTWSYNDCATSGGCLFGPHALTLVTTEYNSDGTTVLSDGTTYFDQLDRPLVANSRQIATYDRKEIQYDNLGRVARIYMPCVWSALTAHCAYSATNTYDALGRVTRTSRPVSATDGTIQNTTIAYAGRRTTTTDAENKVSTQITTVAGTIGRVVDHDNYAQNLTYDAFGSLLNVVDSGGTPLFSASYDYGIAAFQRDVTDADLDVSSASGQHRHYNYDALGELTSWSDAKGQSFSQTYDALSRPVTRTEPDLSTTWSWDSSADNTRHLVGQLLDVSATSSAGTYAEAHSFDGAGRPVATTYTIPADGTYTYDYSYDAATGLPDTLTYPTSTSAYRLKLQYTYQNGILQKISDFNSPATAFWTLNSMNARGQVTQETLGDGVVTTRAFDDVTGWLGKLQSGTSGNWEFQNDTYLFDKVGNVTQRQNGNTLLTESFTYDNVYRLQSSTLQGTPNLSLTYYPNGNIKTRSDVASGATWTYDASKVHAVTQAGSSAYSYSYDANGNAQSRVGLTINWTSYNHPSLINGINQYDGTLESVSFAYNQNHTRWRAVYSGSTGVETTFMVGKLFEKVVSAGSTDYRHYILASGAKIAVYSRTTAGANTLHYLREDHQGSLAAILTLNTTTGQIDALKESFTAFGNRRSTCTWSGNPTAGNLAQTAAVTRHGYTWQEALGAMGLNDMNGRVQDAITGRFLSADPLVGDPGFTQAYNRYSYVNNNPLSYTDPTGFLPQAAADELEDGGDSDLGVGGGGGGDIDNSHVPSIVDSLPAPGTATGNRSTEEPSTEMPGSRIPLSDTERALGIGSEDKYSPGSDALGFILTTGSGVTGGGGIGHPSTVRGPSGSQTPNPKQGPAVVVPGISGVQSSGDLARYYRYLDCAEAGTAFPCELEAELRDQVENGAISQDTADVILANHNREVGAFTIDLFVMFIPGGQEAELAEGADIAIAALHHPWPKYLGGAAKQGLVKLTDRLHNLYHAGLDKILPRQWGSAYYQGLSRAAKQRVLKDLATYTKAFDAKYGTKLYDAMVRNGVKLP